ncbi:MAG: hypothetical protein MSA80_02465 [Prevotella sp.]|nr:hypothetical protein [Prevotella sp.]
MLELPCKDYDKAPFSSAIDFSVETTKKRWSYDKAPFSSAIDGVEASANEGWRWDLG